MMDITTQVGGVERNRTRKWLLSVVVDGHYRLVEYPGSTRNLLEAFDVNETAEIAGREVVLLKRDGQFKDTYEFKEVVAK